jgi:hypothetical protein
MEQEEQEMKKQQAQEAQPGKIENGEGLEQGI